MSLSGDFLGKAPINNFVNLIPYNCRTKDFLHYWTCDNGELKADDNKILTFHGSLGFCPKHVPHTFDGGKFCCSKIKDLCEEPEDCKHPDNCNWISGIEILEM